MPTKERAVTKEKLLTRESLAIKENHLTIARVQAKKERVQIKESHQIQGTFIMLYKV